MSSNKKIQLWLKQKLKLVLYYADSLQAAQTYRFNRMGMIMLSVGFVLVLLAVFWVLVVFTPVKTMIPGYPDRNIRKHMIMNKVRIDSLEEEVIIRDQYLEMLRNAILGISPIDSAMQIPVPANAKNDAASLGNEQDKVADYSGISSVLNKEDNSYTLVLYPPVKGIVTNSFHPAHGHFGTDIVPQKDASVYAALNGTVVLANYTVETGYSIVIQHSGNVLTVYRHNKSVTVEAGDRVKAGQQIAIFGNTGELSTGAHLHFELWRNGVALDPELYTDF